MEEFKKIKGYPSYEVSNLGRVKSLSKNVVCAKGIRITKERMMKIKTMKSGYQTIQMGKSNPTLLIHRLVAIAFIDNPENKPQVNHKNGIKDDNRLVNLEWMTQSENQLHAYRTGLQKPSNHERAKGESVGSSKLKTQDVISIRKEYNGRNATVLGFKYGVSQVTILNIKNFKTWKSC